MDERDFCFLVGDGAIEYALNNGFQQVDPLELIVGRELELFEKIKDDAGFVPKNPFDQTPSDTVGAVALDRDGNLAAATSTGGTPRKHPGRLGDSPVCGAGTYADNEIGAASSTGYGESIIKVCMAKTACDRRLCRSHGGCRERHRRAVKKGGRSGRDNFDKPGRGVRLCPQYPQDGVCLCARG